MREKIYGPRWWNYAAMAAMKSKRHCVGNYRRPHYVKDPGIVGTFYGVTVARARSRLPYGHSTHSGYLTHRVEHVYICWFEGEFVGRAVRWVCGSWTKCFALVEGLNGTPCTACEKKFAEKSAKSLPQQHTLG